MKVSAPRLALLVCLVAALAAPVAAARQQRVTLQTGLEGDVLAQLNAIRAAHDLMPLKLSPGLDAAATQHTREMVRLDYFAHDSADGTSFDDRIERYYPFSARFHTWSVGENLVFEAPTSMLPRRCASGWRARLTGETSSIRTGARSASRPCTSPAPRVSSAGRMPR